jgi:hypothetical protein
MDGPVFEVSDVNSRTTIQSPQAFAAVLHKFGADKVDKADAAASKCLNRGPDGSIVVQYTGDRGFSRHSCTATLPDMSSVVRQSGSFVSPAWINAYAATQAVISELDRTGVSSAAAKLLLDDLQNAMLVAAEVFKFTDASTYATGRMYLKPFVDGIYARKNELSSFPSAVAAAEDFVKEVAFPEDFHFFMVQKKVAMFLLTTRIAGLTMFSFNFIGTSELEVAVLVGGTISLHNYGSKEIPHMDKVFAVPNVSPADSSASGGLLASYTMRSPEDDGTLIDCPMMVTVPESAIDSLLCALPTAWRTEAKKRAFIGTCISRGAVGPQEILDLAIGINGV